MKNEFTLDQLIPQVNLPKLKGNEEEFFKEFTKQVSKLIEKDRSLSDLRGIFIGAMVGATALDYANIGEYKDTPKMMEMEERELEAHAKGLLAAIELNKTFNKNPANVKEWASNVNKALGNVDKESVDRYNFEEFTLLPLLVVLPAKESATIINALDYLTDKDKLGFVNGIKMFDKFEKESSSKIDRWGKIMMGKHDLKDAKLIRTQPALRTKAKEKAAAR